MDLGNSMGRLMGRGERGPRGIHGDGKNKF